MKRIPLYILLVVVVAAAAIWFFWYGRQLGWFGQKTNETPAPFEAKPIEQPTDSILKKNTDPIVYFSNWSYQDEQGTLGTWDTYLDQIKAWGANTILTEVPWFKIEPRDGEFGGYERYDEYYQHAVDRGFKLILGLDAGILRGGSGDLTKADYHAVPDWVFEKYPDAKMQDFEGNKYKALSFSQEKAMQESYEFMEHAVKHFKDKFGDNIIAFNPVYNNEFETRFMQQNFFWTDYGSAPQDKYQEFLKEKYGDIADLNQFWGTGYGSFDQVEPLRVDQNQRGFEPDVRPEFIDWMSFRESAIAGAVIGATEAIHDAGGQVYLHFGEVLTKIDAIYTIPLELLADHTDMIAIDYNHLTADFQTADPSSAGLITSYARGQGVPVIFETSIERMADKKFDKRRDAIIQESIRWAMANGSAGIGVANYLTPWDGLFTFQRSVPATMKEAKTFTDKPVALYASKWQVYGFHSSNDYRNDEGTYDFWQSNNQGLFKALEDAGFPVAVLSDEAIKRGALKDYDVLFMPYQMVVPEDTLKEIRDFNSGGGKLVQDMRFAEYSLTGKRDEKKLEDMFGVTVKELGIDTSATASDALQAKTENGEVIVGDSQLQSNATSGLFTTTWVTPDEGTTTHMNRVGSKSTTMLAINAEKGTAFLGYMPGLLYLQRTEKELQDDIKATLRFVVETLRQ
jgi:hypothetical protein